MKVRDVMSRRPVTLKKIHTLNHALSLMAKHNVRECPVVSGDCLIGMISESDITRTADVHNKINKIDDLPIALLLAIKGNYDGMKKDIKQLLDKKVHTVMSRQIISISPQDDLYKAMKLINKHDVRSLPVVEGRQLKGIISRTDVIRKLSEN